MSKTYTPSPRARVKRAHHRAAYDTESVFAILDSAQMIHVGYVIDDQPYVTPTLHWRDGETFFCMARAPARCYATCVTAHRCV